MEGILYIKIIRELVELLGYTEDDAILKVKEWKPMVQELARWEKDEDFAAIWIAHELDSLGQAA